MAESDNDKLQLPLFAYKAKAVVGKEYSTPRGLYPTDAEQKVIAALINEKVVPISAHGHCLYPFGLNALENVVVHSQLAGMQIGMARALDVVSLTTVSRQVRFPFLFPSECTLLSQSPPPLFSRRPGPHDTSALLGL